MTMIWRSSSPVWPKRCKVCFRRSLDNTLTALNGITLPPPEVLARTLLNDLVLLQQDFILVLDDYHVILNRAIHDLMSELVSHPPHTLHLVIASRYDPPFLLAGLRARGHVTELRGGDLRFTPQEAGQFLAETMALTLDEQTISALAAKTEGWPAGLRLAALSLRQQQPLALLAPDSLGHNLYIMDYLVAEVLSQLPTLCSGISDQDVPSSINCAARCAKP